MVIQTSVSGRHFLRNEPSEFVASRKQWTVFVATIKSIISSKNSVNLDNLDWPPRAWQLPNT